MYETTREHLNCVLEQRKKDRAFVDQHTQELQSANRTLALDALDYRSVIGLKDDQDRVVIGGLTNPPATQSKIEIPEFLRGFQLTLFGPPDTAKLSINAMNLEELIN